MPEEREVQIEEDETEVMAPKEAPDPGKPTARQVALHRLTHLPFRLWCKWCVLGRGRGMQHRRLLGGLLIPILGLDYFFLTKGGVKKRDDLDYTADAAGAKALEDARASGEIVKCLLVRCFASKVIFAHVVAKKGVDEENTVANMVLDDLEWLGHTRVIIKADGEPALQALAKRVITMAKVECKDLEQVSKEDPAAYDSQANGGTEVGVRLVRGLLRTVKLCIEQRLEKYIPVDHPVMSWMLEHVCLLLNVMVVGADGLTAWTRVRGRPFRQQLLGFGEMVLYKHPSKGPRHAPDGNVGAIGGEGAFLGYSKSSNTFIVGTPSGWVYARSVTRRPEADRWDPEALAQLKGHPGSDRRQEEPQRVRFDKPATEQGPTAEAVRQTAIRRLRINKSDLDAHGHDPDCPQCTYIQKYGKPRPGGNHSDRCRRRLEEAMQQTEAGRARLAVHDERITQAMAERIENSDKQAAERQAQPAAAQSEASRGFLERAPDGEPVEFRRGPQPPEAARVRTAAEPAAAEVEPARGEIDTETGWLPVPNGEAAPVTPRGTPHADEPVVVDADGPGASDDESRCPRNSDDEMIDMGAEDAERDVEMEFVGCLQVADDIGKLEPSADDSISELLLQQLGSCGKSYRREARVAVRKIVSEIYSPPRVTAMIRQSRLRHILPGYALDLTVNDPADGRPWDFCLREKRDRARQLFREQKPSCSLAPRSASSSALGKR